MSQVMFSIEEINTQYWGVHKGYKHRVRRCGSTPKGKAWYVVETKSADDFEAQWAWGLCGTAEWLNLSQQSIDWAEKNNKTKK